MNDISTLISIILIILTFVSMWKVFQKAGRQGWEAIIPIYNLFVIQSIIKKPWYWVILMLIPVLGIIWYVWSINLLGKSFGKGLGFTLGLIFLPIIFYPILAFSDSQFNELA